MRNKFTLNEGEIQRILGLHKKAILKENNYQVLNEEQTHSLKINCDFESSSSNSEDYTLRLYKGTPFKPSTKIKNSLVTTRQVRVDYVYGFGSTAGASGLNNKAFVIYNCKTKRMYTVQNTKIDEFDYKTTKWTYDANNMRSLDNLCLKAAETGLYNLGTVTPEVKITPEKKVDGTSELDPKVNPKVKGNRYTFDFDTIMKAIDDTGKCSNIISDVSEVYKQTKQEKFLLQSENGTLVYSNVSTPEGSEWKNDYADYRKKGAYTRVGTNIIIFLCEANELLKGVAYSFYDNEKKTKLSNEELGSILKNKFCNSKINQDQNVKDEPIGDKVKSGLNNDVNPINTTISKDKYYEYISN